MSKLANNPNFDYLGIKLLSMPIESATIERRIGVNYDAVSILNLIIFYNFCSQFSFDPMMDQMFYIYLLILYHILMGGLLWLLNNHKE